MDPASTAVTFSVVVFPRGLLETTSIMKGILVSNRPCFGFRACAPETNSIPVYII
jgi:hypothetical protein